MLETAGACYFTGAVEQFACENNSIDVSLVPGAHEKMKSVRFISRQGEAVDEQLGCILSKNYLDEAGMAACQEDAIKSFFDEFAIGEAASLIKEVLPDCS